MFKKLFRRLLLKPTTITLVNVKRLDGEWDHSEFPHPLVTLDYDEHGRLLNVEVAGNNLEVTAYP